MIPFLIPFILIHLSIQSDSPYVSCGHTQLPLTIGEPFNPNLAPSRNICLIIKSEDKSETKLVRFFPWTIDQQEVMLVEGFTFTKDKKYTIMARTNAVESPEIDFITDDKYYPLILIVLNSTKGQINSIKLANFSKRMGNYNKADAQTPTGTTGPLVGIGMFDLKLVVAYHGTDTNERFFVTGYKVDLNNTATAETLKKKYDAAFNEIV